MKSASVLLCLAVLPQVNAAEWIKVSTPNFDLYTSSTPSAARQTLETFEQARDFFQRVKTSSVISQLPVVLVGFDTMKEYKPYSPNAFTLAYFISDEQRDYIVMSDLGDERARVAVHEYVHLLVRHSGLALPMWLNEGMAEAYSTMEVQDGRILLGAMPKDRVFSLTHENWLHLPAIIRVTEQSREYNEGDRASMFYAQSWLLVHMLMFGDDYAGRFAEFVERVSTSGSTQAAFLEVYGKTLPEMERAMNAYFRQTMGASAYRAALQKVETGPARPASKLEVGLIQARLLEFAGRSEESAKQLRQLAAANPESPDIDEAQAYLDWKNGNRQAALKNFEMALRHGASSWKTEWDYARLLVAQGGDRQIRVDALRKALEVKPDLIEARLMLGGELYSMGRQADAIAELRRIENVDSEHAAAMYLTLAYACADLKQDQQAREYAEQARKYAKRADEVAAVEGLFRKLQNGPVVENSADPDRPTLRRRK